MRRLAVDLEEVTTFDLSESVEPIETAKLVVIGGHSEYWPERLRDALDRHVANGGKIAVFGGNTGWVHVNVSDRQMFTNFGTKDSTDPRWKGSGRPFEPRINRPIEKLLGLSYFNGGYALSAIFNHEDMSKYHLLHADYRKSRGLQVVDASHPLFDGTGLKDKDRFGTEYDLMFVEVDVAVLRGDGVIDFCHPAHGPA